MYITLVEWPLPRSCSFMHTYLTLGGGGAVLWGVNRCSPSLESVGSSAGRACLGLRPECLPCPGPVRSPVDFLVFGFLADWRIASSKEGGSWYGGRVLKSLCGPLAGYAEFISSSPVLCARRPFLAKREPGLSSISGCRTESEGRKCVIASGVLVVQSQCASLPSLWWKQNNVDEHVECFREGWIEEELSINYNYTILRS